LRRSISSQRQNKQCQGTQNPEAHPWHWGSEAGRGAGQAERLERTGRQVSCEQAATGLLRSGWWGIRVCLAPPAPAPAGKSLTRRRAVRRIPTCMSITRDRLQTQRRARIQTNHAFPLCANEVERGTIKALGRKAPVSISEATPFTCPPPRTVWNPPFCRSR